MTDERPKRDNPPPDDATRDERVSIVDFVTDYASNVDLPRRQMIGINIHKTQHKQHTIVILCKLRAYNTCTREWGSPIRWTVQLGHHLAPSWINNPVQSWHLIYRLYIENRYQSSARPVPTLTV